ncbi:MAG: OB-fold domain-containing protein [Actinomycetota bacterium]|nr:OB-fold domain-containing protein [Actinomycetota bacterium]MDP2288025.1 OB-fold domain-containing protein [Actinomycetota bacterium]
MKSALAQAGLGEFATLNVDTFTKPFWDAAREHRLVVPQCDDCGTFHLPPSPFCHECDGEALSYTEVPGTGEVYSFTIVRHPVVPALASVVPYVIAVVDLDGAPGARLVGNVIDCVPEAVHIGSKVTVVYDDIDDDVTIPRFVLN